MKFGWQVVRGRLWYVSKLMKGNGWQLDFKEVLIVMKGIVEEGFSVLENPYLLEIRIE